MKSYKITVNGIVYDVMVEEVEAAASDFSEKVAAPVSPAPQIAPSKSVKNAPATSLNIEGTKVSAPLPGTVVKVNVAAGDTVKKGQVLLVLEAMKMENDIVSPADGTIVTVSVSRGASVNAGTLLAVIR